MGSFWTQLGQKWIFVCIALTHSVYAQQGNTKAYALTVNGTPVSREEFVWFAQQQRASVFEYVKTKCNLDYDKDFWDQACDGTTPRLLLQKKTVEKIVAEKIQQLLFKELGVIQDVRFSAFCENLNKINRQRRQDVWQNEVVYGPVSYTPLQYYGHWMALSKIKAQELLALRQFDVTPAGVNDFYEKNKSAFGAPNDANEAFPESIAHIVKARYIDWQYDQLIKQRIERAVVKLNPQVIAGISPDESVSLSAPSVMTQIGAVSLANVQGRIDHLSVDLKSNRLFVACLENNTVEVIDLTAGKQTASIRSGGRPQSALFIGDVNSIVVTNGSKGQIEWYDAATFERVRTTDFAGGDTDNLRYDLQTKHLYVAYGQGAIGVLDAATGNILADIPLPKHPESFQIDSGTAKIFVNIPEDRSIAVVSLPTLSLTKKWSLTKILNNYPMALDQTHRRLFVGCRKPAKLLVYDMDKQVQVAVADCVGDADDIFYDADRCRLYVIGGEGFVSIFNQLDADQYELIDNAATAPGARTGLFVPQARKLYIAAPAADQRAAQIMIWDVK